MNANATYPLAIAARTAGFSVKQFLRKRDHGFLKLRDGDRPSTGTGEPVGYSRNRIVEAATMRWLGDLRVPASIASAAALKFVNETQPGRGPGECFKHGRTILLVTPDGSVVKNVMHDATLADVTDGAYCAVTLDMNKVAAAVDQNLNLISIKRK
jgi:hypothetical protein